MLRQTYYSVLWDSYLQSVKQVSLDSNLNTAKSILSAALRDAEEYRELDERLEWCTYGIADECQARGDHAGAEQLYKNLIEAKEKILGLNHPSVQAGLEKLALVQMNAKPKTSNQIKAGCKFNSDLSEADKQMSVFVTEKGDKVAAFFQKAKLSFINLVNQRLGKINKAS